MTEGITTDGYGTQWWNGPLNVLRRDMSRFIERARGKTAKIPPNPCAPTFADVPCTDPDWGWIQQFYEDGITAGCGTNPLRFCPNDPVTRQQMAVFIEVGLGHPKEVNCTIPTRFADVPCESNYWGWIERLAKDEITAGCGGGNFCPTLQVTRDQMAVFLTTGWHFFAAAGPATPWHLYSQSHQLRSDAAYAGFPYQLISYPYDVTTYNSGACTPDACFTNDISSSCSIGVRQIYAGAINNLGHFTAPDSTYWDFQLHGAGKVLYSGGTPRFRNPLNGVSYPFVMYFGSELLGAPCGGTCAHSGLGTAYSSDGLNFVEGQHAAPLIGTCDLPPGQSGCTNYNWWCDHGWPCDTATPRRWWTDSEIASPLFFTDNKLYLASLEFLRGKSDCVEEDDLCWPTNPLHAGTATYVLQSTDGVNWSRYMEPNGDFGRFARLGIDTSTPCYHAAWLINVDWAYDPIGDDFYMTRSYASDAAAANDPVSGCAPSTLPDHVQLYKTHGSVGLFYGPWQLLFDGGCATLGYQPDSASILHDGRGNAVLGTGGSITLLVSSSHGSVCGRSPFQYHSVVIGP
jgi:hypothetical protein